jgi:hypothetical protein
VHRVSVNLTQGEYARLLELRPEGMSDSAFFRQLLRRAGPVEEVPTRLEAIRLLGDSARSGKVAAQVALVRELRDASDRNTLDWILHGDE